MAYRKHVLVSVVLLAISGILFGCGDSTVAPTTTTEAPIVAPSNVTAQELANGDVMILWDASSQTNLRGYNVYRLDLENQRIGKLNAAELSQNSYVDQTADRDVQYEYRVTAISTRGTESNYSAVVVVVESEQYRDLPRREMK
jgi:fibronectin type 3 domain-containing protein